MKIWKNLTKNGKKRLTLLLSLALLLTVAAGTTLAYLMMQTGSLQNKFLSDVSLTRDLTIQKTVEFDEAVFGKNFSAPEIIKDIEFNFTVDFGDKYANRTVKILKNGTETGELSLDAEGVAKLTLKHNESIAFLGIDVGTEVKITEDEKASFYSTSIEALWKTENNQTSGNTITHVILDDPNVINENSFKFVNKYTASKVDPVNLTLVGTKTLKDRDWQEGDRFVFQLQIWNPGTEEWDNVLQGEKTVVYEKIKVKEDDPNTTDIDETEWALPKPEEINSFELSEALINYDFTTAGDYIFRIAETDCSVVGMTYNTTESEFKVVVGDNNMDGKLEIQSVTSNNASVKISEDHKIEVEVVNKYAPAVAYINIEKVVLDASQQGLDQDTSGFYFGLYDADTGELIKTYTTSYGEEPEIELIYGKEDVGSTFHYVLKEEGTDTAPAGWTYDTTQYNLQVDVVENQDGTISAFIMDTGAIAPITEEEDIEDPIQPTFAVDPTEGDYGYTEDSSETTGATEATVTDVETTGATTETTEETTETTAETTEVTEATTQATTEATEENPTVFRLPGSSTSVTPTETSESSDPEDSSVTTESSGDATATSEDLGGTFSLPGSEATTDSGSGTFKLPGAESPQTDGEITLQGAEKSITVRFSNSYDPVDAYATIDGKKELTGRAMKLSEFKFEFYETGSDFNITDKNPTFVRENDNSGNFSFGEFKYETVGTRYYVVKEVLPSGISVDGKLNGVTYDKTVYHVTVAVTDEGGKLKAVPQITTSNGTVEAGIVFRNTYTAASVTIDGVTGTKLLNSEKPGNWTFKFRLYTNTNGQHLCQGEYTTAESNSDGIFTFAPVTYTFEQLNGAEQKEFWYTLAEDSDNPVDGMTYDSTIYGIKDLVTDGGNGQLTVTRTIARVDLMNSELVSEIVFRNTYVEPEKPTTEPTTAPTETTTEPDEPTETTKKPSYTGGDNSKTGDESHVWQYVTIAVLSGGALILLLIFGRRKKRGKYE